jgi:tRNA (guanine37-N1)-methyltransferase
MRFDILTLFPEMIEGMIHSSILERAIEKNLLEVHIIDFREYSTNKHHTVDDYAYGGGAGMLISVEPIVRALKEIPGYESAKKILTSPSGTCWTEQMAYDFSKEDHIIIVCGHYEGIDARILSYMDEEISIGDYVLTGGEIPAGILVDSISRLVKGVISEDSLSAESFTNDLLEYPQYTHPLTFEDKTVPDILLSGHHANIERWKKKEAIRKTYQKRPDLIKKHQFTKEELKLFEEVRNEEK